MGGKRVKSMAKHENGQKAQLETVWKKWTGENQCWESVGPIPAHVHSIQTSGCEIYLWSDLVYIIFLFAARTWLST